MGSETRGHGSENHARPSRLGWLALVPLTLFVVAFGVLVRRDFPARASVEWVPSLGVDLAFRIDGLALEMILLVTGIGAFVFVYAAGYMAGDRDRTRLFVLLLIFMGAMLGCVSADDLIVLYVFWEITGITSFLLVGLKHEDPLSRASAQQALLVTLAGGFALLAGILLLGQIAGTYSIEELQRTAPAWRHHGGLEPILLCLFAGAFTKSAQIPFHFWLPNAMAAPTPVSAYLHSATMVTLGVYLMARLDPAFDSLPFWEFTLVTWGGLTSTWAMLQTLRERDLKRIFAWSTVSSLGTMMMLVGLPGEASAPAVAAMILAHALYKAPLFFVAGNVDHGTGTRDINRLAKLAVRMPWTAAAAFLAAASMSGFPLSFGFLAKELTKLAEEEGDAYAWVGDASVMVSAVTVAVAGIAAVRVFLLKEGGALPRKLHEPRWGMRLPPVAIAATGILFGVRPDLIDPLIGAAAEAIAPRHSFEAASELASAESGWFALMLALLLGLVVYAAWDRLHALLGELELPTWVRAQDWYGRLLRGVPRLATRVTSALQNGSLTWYLELQLLFIVLCLASALGVSGEFGGSRRGVLDASGAFGPAGGAALGATGLLIAGALAVCLVRDSFLLLLSSGLMGLASALLFLFLGAPDLAFTQFAVEVAFVVVIASILLRLRRLDATPRPVTGRGVRLLLAGAVGALCTWALSVALESPDFDDAVPRAFGALSLGEAHGHNVVNVILVDFRALDTLGEITVVFIGFLAVVPLVRALRAPEKTVS